MDKNKDKRDTPQPGATAGSDQARHAKDTRAAAPGDTSQQQPGRNDKQGKDANQGTRAPSKP